MRAEELKRITEQAEIENAEKFWGIIKDELFDGMKKMAESRLYSLKLTPSDKIVSGYFNWIEYSPLRNKVELQLKALGYSVTWSNDVRDGVYFIISWE